MCLSQLSSYSGASVGLSVPHHNSLAREGEPSHTHFIHAPVPLNLFIYAHLTSGKSDMVQGGEKRGRKRRREEERKKKGKKEQLDAKHVTRDVHQPALRRERHNTLHSPAGSALWFCGSVSLCSVSLCSVSLCSESLCSESLCSESLL